MKSKAIQPIQLKDAIQCVNEKSILIACQSAYSSFKELRARIVIIGNDTEVFYDVFSQGKCINTINSLPIALEQYNNI